MAADDDGGQAPDPWDEIVAEGLGDGAGEMSFRFEDAAPDVDSGAAESTDSTGESALPAEVAGDEPPTSAAEAADDALVEDWLAADDGSDAATPPLSVFSPEDAASGSSAIDIGTGASGIGLHGAAAQEEIGGDAFAAAADADEWGGLGGGAGDADGAAGDGFPIVTAGAAAAAGGAATVTRAVRSPARPAKKAGGIGQMIGVVLGGLMAIPITLAILIYGLGKDPFGVAKMMPREVAFLLPQKFRPGFKKAAAAVDAGGATGRSPLDDLPPAPPQPSDEPVAPSDEAVATAGGEPTDPAPVDPVADPSLVVEPGAPAETVALAGPELGALDGPPAPPAPPEPPPLDTASLDEAVGEAAALGEALGAVDDRDNRAYKLLRTRWYRALARVAEELVAVEDAAATSGRPLAGAPANVAALHGAIGGRESLAAELVALAPDWLAYAKRGSDGVVASVTFETARKVGPYWTARVTLAGTDGTSRDLTVVSRHEPAAIAGDRLVVTGVAIDGGVIWAADVRNAAAGEVGGF